MDPIEAICKSRELTRGHGMTLFGMGVLSILAIRLGLLCLVVGIFVSIIWINAAYAGYYHTLTRNHSEEPP